MKPLKGLIHIVYPPAFVMGIYFMFINFIGAISMIGDVNRAWSEYLSDGIVNIGFRTMNYNNIFVVSMFYCVGMLLLVYLQFCHEKSIEIGRFIKALPYTNKQKATVKIIVGFLSFTIPYIVYVLVFLGVKNYTMDLWTEAYQVTAYEEIIGYLNSSTTYLSFMYIAYLRIAIVYLIFVLWQYGVSHNVGSLLIGCGSILAPVYIMISLVDTLNDTSYMEKIQYGLEQIYLGIGGYGEVYSTNMPYEEFTYLLTKQNPKIVCIYIVILLILSSLISLQIDKQRLELNDILMPQKIVRTIFIVGIALCGGCLIKDIMNILLDEVFMIYSKLLLTLFFVIGCGISGLIAFKIAHIGIQKKGVKYER